MKIHASGEDYLEAILVLQKKMGMVRSIDLARHMGFSKPSISHAVGVLKNGGFLTVDDDGFLHRLHKLMTTCRDTVAAWRLICRVSFAFSKLP